MVNIISRNEFNVCEIAADTYTDLATADKALLTDVAMGSRAIAIDTGMVYMLNSSGEWVQISSLNG